MADVRTGRKPFIQLTDVPPSYVTFGTNRVVVNPTETGLIFVPDTFLEDQDTPNSYVTFGTNRVVVNPGETGLIFVPDTFLEDQDTPNSYVGQASKYVKVNPGETGLIFDTYPLRSQNVATIAGQNDYTILIDASLGNLVVTLPSSLTFPRIIYNIKKIDSSAFTVTVTPILAQTIDGAANYVLTVPNQSVTIQSDNANWVVLLDDTFLKELDTPDSYVGQATNRVVVNPGETALIFVPDTFLEEQDTPNSYIGQAGNFVNVNPTETALQFVTPAIIAGAIGPFLTPEITNKGKQWIQHGDNVITLRNAQLDNNFRVKSTIFLPLGATDIGSPITYRGVSHAGSAKANSMAIVARPDTTTTVKVRLEGGFGYVGLGFIVGISSSSQRFDDIVDTQTTLTTGWTARQLPSGYSLNGYGFTSGGRVVASSGVTERVDDITTDFATVRANIIARDALSAFTINGYGFTTTGWDTVSATTLNITERFDDATNIQSPRAGEGANGFNSTGQFGLNNFGFVFGGSFANSLDGQSAFQNQRFDDVSNLWTIKMTVPTPRQLSTGYSLNGFGFASGGATAAGIQIGATERFDDTANLWVGRNNLATARSGLAGYSLNGYGFTSCGNSATFGAPANSGVTERYDDVADTQTTRAVGSVKRNVTGFATNEYFVEYNTENVSQFDEILNLGTMWIQHGDNVITLANRHSNLDFRSDLILQLPLGATSIADPITYRGPAHPRPLAITSRPDDPYIGFGFVSGGFVAAVSTVTEQFDDPTLVSTVKDTLQTARQGVTGYSFNGFGFTSCGNTATDAAPASSAVTERLDPIANVQIFRTSVNTGRSDLSSFALNELDGFSHGHVAGGWNSVAAAVSNLHDSFEDNTNTQTAKTVLNNAVDRAAGFVINEFGFVLGGAVKITGVLGGDLRSFNQRYDFIADSWTNMSALISSAYGMAGFAYGGLGYITGGSGDAVSTRPNTEIYSFAADSWSFGSGLNTARYLLAGYAIDGFGFSACGSTTIAGANSNVVERYDPVTTLWTARVPVPVLTARRNLAGYSNPLSNNTNGARLLVKLHGGYGFTSCGATVPGIVGTTQRFDDVTNVQTAAGVMADATAKFLLAGFSLNGLGFTDAGALKTGPLTGLRERFDDVINSQTARLADSPRANLSGYTINGFGFSTCGNTGGNVGTTVRFDDVTNTQAGRLDATPRDDIAGYGLNNFGFSSGGFIAATTGTTERFDDSANFHVDRTIITARRGLIGYSINGFGFSSCGNTTGGAGSTSGITERLDDIANVQSARSVATARSFLAGYSLNGFGFTSGGLNAASVKLSTVERFDDIANLHVARSGIVATNSLVGYATNEYFVNYSTMD